MVGVEMRGEMGREAEGEGELSEGSWGTNLFLAVMRGRFSYMTPIIPHPPTHPKPAEFPISEKSLQLACVNSSRFMDKFFPMLLAV